MVPFLANLSAHWFLLFSAH